MDNVPVRNTSGHGQKQSASPAHAHPRRKKRGLKITLISIVAVVVFAVLVVGGLFLA